MSRLSTIELYRENMKFSSGHFTILSAHKRERLHGHNFTVYAAITARVDRLGMAFDYRYYKKKLLDLCAELNEYFLLPGQSDYVNLAYDGPYCYVHFNDEKIPFLINDIKILPISNVTVEELSRWFIEKILEDQQALKQHSIVGFKVKVYTNPGQSGSYEWNFNDGIEGS